MDQKKSLYVGLMSGTSMDAIDAVLAELNEQTVLPKAWHSHRIPGRLQQELATLCTPGNDTIDLLGKADREMGELFADAVATLLNAAGVAPTQVSAIGSHGQTVRHRPPAADQPHPFTLQVGDPNIIAARTGITTVADFRRADIAAGGQGAPLAPAFHKHVFSDRGQNRVIVNIGGMANLTWLPIEGEVLGFDSGPGNRLLDYWCEKHMHQAFDRNGQWASRHGVDELLLQALLDHHFFRVRGPKSTGREVFNETWLEAQLRAYERSPEAGAVQSSLAALTAETITNAIATLPARADAVFICGGGAANTDLVNRLKSALSPVPVESTSSLGVDPDQVEALAFAWLAQRRMMGEAGNLPSVTGAKSRAILGGVFLPQNRKSSRVTRAGLST